MLPRTVCRLVSLASSSSIGITCIIAVVVLLLAVPPASADTLEDGWVSFDGTMTPTPPSVEVMFSSSSEVVLRVTTHGVLCETVTEDTLEFHRLSAPGCYHSPDVGYACLPLIGQLIAVPEGAEIDVSVAVPDSADTMYFSDAAVYPTPALVVEYTPEGWEYLVEEFALEEGYYDTGYYPGEVASVDGEGSLRGQGVARVTVYPLQFDGSTSELVAYPELEVTVSWSGGRGGLAEPTGPLSRVAELVLPNYEGWDEERGAPADTGRWDVCTSVAGCDAFDTDYLMIVESDLMGSIWMLAEHRSLWNGYNVAVVSDATVMANANSQTISDLVIREFIQGLWDLQGSTHSAEHMEDGRLGYVLLVGDARSDDQYDLLPAHEAPTDTTSITTDHWYACVEGDDEYADLMIGRLAVGDAPELVTEASKIRYYEVNARSTDDWRHKALLSCGFAWRGHEISDECDIQDAAFAATVHDAFGTAAPPGYDIDEIHAHERWEPGWICCIDQREATRLLNRPAVENPGYHLVELCVHGYEQGTHTFNEIDAQLLDNDHKLGFWMAYSCLTGSFDYVKSGVPTDCLGELLLHGSGEDHEANGAIGYFGSTELSSNTAWTYLGTYMWRAFFQHNMCTPGEAIAYAKLWSATGAGGAGDPLMFNLLGDPAIDLFLTNGEGYGTNPDYVVRSTEMSATPDLVPCGDLIHLTARVRNTSNFRPDNDVTVLLQICDLDGSECILVDSLFVEVPAWGYKDLEAFWTPGAADIGHRSFRVVVDPEGAQLELREDNNEAMIDVGVLPNRTGFPVSLEGEGGLSPVVVDVDNDGGPEIVAATRDSGEVRVLSASGLADWRFHPSDDQALRGPVACGDLDGNGTLEVVVCYGDSVSARRGIDGQAAWGSLRRYVEGLNSGPVLADVSGGDGRLEVLAGRAHFQGPGSYVDQTVAIKGDGTRILWYGPVSGRIAFPQSQLDRSGASGDLDGDGLCNPVRTYSQCRSVEGDVYFASALSAGHDTLWIDSTQDTTGPYAPPCDPVLADVDPGSPGLEALWGADLLRCLSRDGGLLWDYPVSGYIGGIAAGDLDDNGDLELVVSTRGVAGDPDDCAGHLYVFSAAGAAIDSVALDYAAKGVPVIADLDGGAPEILATSSCFEYLPSDTTRWVSHLDVFTLTQGILARSDALSRPLLFWGELTSSPCVADVDGDGHVDIVLVDGAGKVHCLENSSWGGGEPLGWPCFQHDERHTGVYETAVCDTYPPNTTASWWGNYLMTGDVTVDGSSSLVVQPGTTVRAALDDDQEAGADSDLVELVVEGTLRAGGDSLRHAVFTSAAESPQPDDWLGIRLRPGCTGVIDDATISYAEQAIYAHKPDTLRLTDSDLLESDLRGIRCKSDSLTGQVLIRGNTISGATIGITLYDCDADIDSNTISDCSGYGMEICGDAGSSIHDNHIVQPTYGYLSFGGLCAKGSAADLVIAHNWIGDASYGIPNRAIEYENSDPSDTAMIKDNTITLHPSATMGTGMYFYQSKPRVRGNMITGKTLHTAFLVAGSTATRPYLGDATAGDCCSDTTLAGCNSVVTEDDPAQWYVYVASGPSDTLKAECNYWDPPPDSTQFYGNVDWTPYLRGRRGLPSGGGEPDQPPALALLPNTPNPFNPETVFRFGLPEAGRARLEVYDLAGRHVRTLVDGPVSAGWQTATWDGRGDGGERVASGVYFCRLEVGARELSRKVVVLK